MRAIGIREEIPCSDTPGHVFTVHGINVDATIKSF
jgi:hypothetical protein